MEFFSENTSRRSLERKIIIKWERAKERLKVIAEMQEEDISDRIFEKLEFETTRTLIQLKLLEEIMDENEIEYEKGKNYYE